VGKDAEHAVFKCLQRTITVGRHHYALVAAGYRTPQQFETVLAPKVEVQQQAVVDIALQAVAGCLQIGHGIEACARSCQLGAQPLQTLAYQRFVFNDQDAHVSSIRPHHWLPSMPCTKLHPPGLAAARLASM